MAVFPATTAPALDAALMATTAVEEEGVAAPLAMLDMVADDVRASPFLMPEASTDVGEFLELESALPPADATTAPIISSPPMLTGCELVLADLVV
jgi:hypothetical protein